MRLVSLQAGTKLNVVPGKAYAELAGMAKEDLKTCADETEQKTGVSFVLEDTENGNIKITACGAFAHASTPEMGNNALTALLQLLASVGMEESELKNDISFLAKVYPHGDGKGAGLGVAMSDEESGELTLSLDLMNYDGKTLTGSYDCRAPICATKENLYDTAEQNMKKAAFPWKAVPCSRHTTFRQIARSFRRCCSAIPMSPANREKPLRSAAERMSIT